MKKTILTLTASLLFGAAAVFAQDTTRTEQQRDQQTQQDRYRTEGMVEVQEADLPEAVVTTLEGSQYEGWRDGSVFLDPESGEYIIVIEKSGESAKEFRLDRSGSDVTDRSKSGQQNRQNQDPVNQETDTAAQQQQGQDTQYKRDDQQQNDQENQNDDALQSDTTQSQNQNEQGQNQNEDATQTDTDATQTDTTQMNREGQNQDQSTTQQDQQYRRDQTDTTQVNQEGQTETTTEDTATQGQDETAQRDQSVSATEEGNASSESAYRTDESSRRAGHMEGHYRVINSNELPQAVVTALDESTYEGWKENVVYVDTKTGDYIVQAKATAGEGEGKYYRLNKEGQDISKHKDKDMDKSAKEKAKTDKANDDN